MSNQSTYTELRTRYQSAWTEPTTEYDNEKFTKPNDIWARFVVNFGDENQLDIGDSLHSFRTEGVLTIQFFAPPESGSITVLAKADTCAGYFRNWCGATVTCRGASVRRIGNDELGWYQVNVVVPFKVDELH